MAKDLDLFKAAMVDVTPLRRDKPAKEGAPKPRDKLPTTPREKPAPAVAMTKTVSARLETFDRDIDRALARGRRAPEASLDLHGMTLAAAERAVSRFLAEQVELGHRVVLIVTGKGLRMEGGKVFGGRIRAEFPAWLERPDNRARIAGLRAAHPRHGGSGAFYVLLRRRIPRAVK